MKRLNRMLGVTLLEIMLVLAIAAMVIVMSIRYYQSASTNQKIAAAMNAITAIVAGAESYLSATGTLATLTSTSGTGTILPYIGGAMPTSPWGGTIVAAGTAANVFTITFAPVIPATGACVPLKALVEQNSKMSMNCTTSVITVTE